MKIEVIALEEKAVAVEDWRGRAADKMGFFAQGIFGVFLLFASGVGVIRVGFETDVVLFLFQNLEKAFAIEAFVETLETDLVGWGDGRIEAPGMGEGIVLGAGKALDNRREIIGCVFWLAEVEDFVLVGRRIIGRESFGEKARGGEVEVAKVILEVRALGGGAEELVAVEGENAAIGARDIGDAERGVGENEIRIAIKIALD